ncbi:hypothetical protein HDU76_009444, partial [Blyttiomyces sp. JEL0837]
MTPQQRDRAYSNVRLIMDIALEEIVSRKSVIPISNPGFFLLYIMLHDERDFDNVLLHSDIVPVTLSSRDRDDVSWTFMEMLSECWMIAEQLEDIAAESETGSPT